MLRNRIALNHGPTSLRLVRRSGGCVRNRSLTVTAPCLAGRSNRSPNPEHLRSRSAPPTNPPSETCDQSLDPCLAPCSLVRSRVSALFRLPGTRLHTSCITGNTQGEPPADRFGSHPSPLVQRPTHSPATDPHPTRQESLDSTGSDLHDAPGRRRLVPGREMPFSAGGEKNEHAGRQETGLRGESDHLANCIDAVWHFVGSGDQRDVQGVPASLPG